MEPFASAPAAPPSSVGLVSHLLSTISLHSDGVAIQRAIEFLPRHRTDALSVSIGDAWREVRSWALAPVLRVAIVVCLVMSVMLLVEVVSMAVVSLAIKILRRRPESRYCWEPINAGDDPESGNLAFPMVLVQIPMYNEREVYKLSIGAACTLSWPSDRIIIQILDDSTDPTVKGMVEIECRHWASKGINIHYEVRNNRKGYKAGALKLGMEHSYAKECEFVAIFDSDFQPEANFLKRTIPFLVHNPRIALVQTRWQFVNFSDCLMTRIQKMTLDYHFKVEQEVGSSTFAFFGFNGTAGVWRISAINEVGGWKDRTTVEDMDLAVRATLRGWKLLYVGDVKVKSELPSTFKAYRRQQHRWTCGAAHLFRKMGIEILKAKEVSIWKKFHLTYSFFFVRKIVAHLVTFFLYCVVIPTSVLVPEVTIPAWGVVYIPSTITILNATRNPSSLHLMPFWILFENVMAMHRMKATIIGLLEAGTFDEWIVTDKLGDTLQDKIRIPLLERASTSLRDRLNLPELGFAAFLFLCACYNLAYGQNYYYVYIYVQAVAFLVVGCGYVGTFITNP
ncbi:glucomannan 4-beta-mannosyltransferase 1-like isoform X1 [Zingiber officinale]|uniref:glucomannan 4-beta-mannosyltransferase 1-like isoform X1 n=1 Tax=Zingiber officinale TaxID=94328 RepID=UPI001C4B1EB2|nr:glucomannan 4-beta-mannosyltransferase 1-like isoform X1 [Zingiber officinale]